MWNFWLNSPCPLLGLWIHWLIVFCLSKFLMKNMLIFLLRILFCVWQFASFLLLSCCYSWWCPLDLLGSVCFSSVLFLYVPQTIILIILSSSSLILLLFDLWISLIRFLFHLLYWQLQIFFFVSFKFSISLLTFPFYLYIVVLTLSTSSFSSPSTFKTTVLKSLSSISAIRSFFTVSVYLLECTMLSCFLVCPVLLFVCLLV